MQTLVWIFLEYDKETFRSEHIGSVSSETLFLILTVLLIHSSTLLLYISNKCKCLIIGIEGPTKVAQQLFLVKPISLTLWFWNDRVHVQNEWKKAGSQKPKEEAIWIGKGPFQPFIIFPAYGITVTVTLFFPS